MPRKAGFKHSEETKRKLSEQKIGAANPSKRLDVRQKIRIARAKQAVTPKMLAALRAGGNWKDGRTKDPKYVSWSKNQWHHRRRNADGKHTYEEWEKMKAQYNWTCPACSLREPMIQLSVDHIVPLSKGGSNNIENIQPLCRKCNSKKNSRTIRYPFIS